MLTSACGDKSHSNQSAFTPHRSSSSIKVRTHRKNRRSAKHSIHSRGKEREQKMNKNKAAVNKIQNNLNHIPVGKPAAPAVGETPPIVRDAFGMPINFIDLSNQVASQEDRKPAAPAVGASPSIVRDAFGMPFNFNGTSNQVASQEDRKPTAPAVGASPPIAFDAFGMPFNFNGISNQVASQEDKAPPAPPSIARDAFGMPVVSQTYGFNGLSIQVVAQGNSKKSAARSSVSPFRVDNTSSLSQPALIGKNGQTDTQYPISNSFCGVYSNTSISENSVSKTKIAPVRKVRTASNYAEVMRMRNEQRNELCKADEELAKQLQEEDTRSYYTDRAKEYEMMASSTHTGKAILLVEKINNLLHILRQNDPSNYNMVQPVAHNDLVALAERTFEKQQYFIDKNISSYVDIGFHYTRPANMQAIQSNGLMTKGDRRSQNIQSANMHGSTFGDGVYTCNNPIASRNYGSVGLLVARLKGNTVRIRQSLKSDHILPAETNTIIGDKIHNTSCYGDWPSTDHFHEYVLRSSSQCIPLIKYETGILESPDGEKCVLHVQSSLQGLLDELFNEKSQPAPMGPIISRNINSPSGSRGMVFNPPNPGIFAAPVISGPPLPSSGFIAPSGGMVFNPPNPGIFATIEYKAPYNIITGIPSNTLIAPLTPNLDGTCVICQDDLSSSNCVAINTCYHKFHRSCIERAFKTKPQCPICRKLVGKPQGKSPSGTMAISQSTKSCSGCESIPSLMIKYHIKKSIQKSYHDNPGQYQHGKYATAYLPYNADGENLLKRLKFAFRHGLTFTVGTSMTTGRTNQCTWSSIHHKSSPTGGVTSHGFPDPGYFVNCNEELDSVNVPPAHSLNDDGTAK